MRLTVVGCSGSFPGRTAPRPATSSRPTGFRRAARPRQRRARALQRHLDLADIDAVLLSHLHPDHCLDLCRSTWRAPTTRPPLDRLPVVVPAGGAEHWRAPTGGPSGRVWPRRSTSTSGRRAAARSARSPSPSPGWRTRSRPTGCGSSTTARCWPTPATPAPCDALVRAGPGRRPALFEAAFETGRDDHAPPDLHLTGREAGAGRRRCRRTPTGAHPHPAVERPGGRAARRGEAFDGPVELAAPARRTTCESVSARAARVVGMTRIDGRTPDQLRDVSHHPRLARPRRGLGARGVRQHPGALRGLGHPGRAALAQGQRPGLGDRGVRDAAALDQHPLRPRVGQGPDRRPHPRDLPAGRPLAARRDRLQGARREHHRARLRRAAGRRRHPHGGDHRRVRRARRRRRPGCAAQGRARRRSRSPRRSPRCPWASSTACRCSTSATTRTSRPRPT